MVTNFTHVEMHKYLFDDMLLLDESDDYYFALAFGAYQRGNFVYFLDQACHQKSSPAVTPHCRRKRFGARWPACYTRGGSHSRLGTGPLQHGRRVFVFIIKYFKGNGIEEYISNETT